MLIGGEERWRPVRGFLDPPSHYIADGSHNIQLVRPLRPDLRQLTSPLRASPQLRTVVIEGIPNINEVVEFLIINNQIARHRAGASLPYAGEARSDVLCLPHRCPIVRLIKERAMNGDLVVIGAFLIDGCPLIEPGARD